VYLNNLRVESMPDGIVARLFGFNQAKLLEYSEAERRDVDLRALFS
jgi:LemA protein